ncbi:MAG: acyltransferase family protein [Lachnospiraceae bacterium]|nr:acyltransferase family protein [Lachnospiraceae bacterium]
MKQIAVADIREKPAKKPRNYRVDNIRFILIFLIIFGHFLETFEGPIKQNIYTIIYSFHIPAFMFLSGLYASFSPQKILRRYVLTYLVFQIIYTAFDAFIYGHSVSFQFSTPYWLLWYLMALSFYELLIPTIDHFTPRKLIIGTFCIAILVGVDVSISMYLTLSRTLVFFPFFILGYVGKENGIERVLNFFTGKKRRLLDCACVLIALLEIGFMFIEFPERTLYGSYAYGLSLYGAGIRIGFFVCALLWLLVLFASIPNKSIRFLSKAGGSTMCAYLLHGFVKIFIQKYQIMCFPETVNILLCLGGALVLVFFCSFLSGTYKKAIIRWRKQSERETIPKEE